MQTQQLKRRLTSRHMSMIAIGGSIGTGIFLASGNAIYTAGPGGAVFAYLLIGLMVYFLMTSLGEMSAKIPVTGTFCEYSTRFVEPAFGFSMSYNYWFSWATAAAVDLSSAAFVMKFWYPNVPFIEWVGLFFILILALNLLAVNLYGELEYWFSATKVATVIIFIVVGVLIIIGVLGQKSVGFHNWTIGDAPFHQGWIGLFGVMLVAGFSFQGTEIFGVTAGEAKDPKTSIPKAVKKIFWRILLFYVFSIAVISFIIPYTDSSLIHASADNIMLSPFTVVFREAGLESAATIVNGIVLIALLSAANASLYTATRMLWHTAKEGNAPKLLARTNKQGVPIIATLASTLVVASVFLSSIFGSGAVFVWLLNASGLVGFITWLGIAISHYRFRKAYLTQGNKLSDLPYQAKFYPFGPIFAFLLCAVILLGQQFAVASDQHFEWSSFIGTYIGLPIFIILYFGYKLIKGSRLVPLAKCDLTENKDSKVSACDKAKIIPLPPKNLAGIAYEKECTNSN